MLLVLGMQASAWIQDRAAEGKESVEQLRASEGYDTQVLPNCSPQ